MAPKLSDLQRTLAHAIEGMSAADFARHPPNKWSTAEILDHLNLTYRGTIKNLERRLASGKAEAKPETPTLAKNAPGSTTTRRKRWQRFVITGLGFFPTGGKSPERVLPRGTPIETLTGEIFQNITRMDTLITECDSRLGNGKPIADHPSFGPLTARQWRKFHLVHGKHHARQILRLKKLSEL